MLLAIANRPVDNNTTFSTGGDVSRFQRSSVPRAAPTQQSNYAAALANGPSSNAAAPVATGPSVRVARGNTVTLVPVGAR